jgi:hypothetical protein
VQLAVEAKVEEHTSLLRLKEGGNMTAAFAVVKVAPHILLAAGAAGAAGMVVGAEAVARLVQHNRLSVELAIADAVAEVVLADLAAVAGALSLCEILMADDEGLSRDKNLSGAADIGRVGIVRPAVSGASAVVEDSSETVAWEAKTPGTSAAVWEWAAGVQMRANCSSALVVLVED